MREIDESLDKNEKLLNRKLMEKNKNCIYLPTKLIKCSNRCFMLQGTTIVCTTWWVGQTTGKGRWAGAKIACKCSSSSPKPRASRPRPPRHPTSIVTWESSSNSRSCRISKVRRHQSLIYGLKIRLLFIKMMSEQSLQYPLTLG